MNGKRSCLHRGVGGVGEFIHGVSWGSHSPEAMVSQAQIWVVRGGGPTPPPLIRLFFNGWGWIRVLELGKPGLGGKILRLGLDEGFLVVSFLKFKIAKGL